MDTLFEPSNLLSWLGIFLTIIIGSKSISYAFHAQFKRDTIKEQLDKAYLPIFQLTEPYLYIDITEENKDLIFHNLKENKKIIHENYKYIRSGIVYWNDYLIDYVSKEEIDYLKLNEWYKEYCWRIDYEFEKARKHLYLPQRTLAYRLNKNHFRSNSQRIRGFLRHVAPQLVYFIVAALISVWLMGVMK